MMVKLPISGRSRPSAIRAITLAGLCLACALLAPQPVRALPDFYWEEPVRLSRGQGAYPQAFRSGDRVVAVWQESTAASGGGSAWISAASWGPDGSRVEASRFIGPLPWRGEGAAPVMYSAAVDARGVMAIAAVSGDSSISVYLSGDGGRGFSLAGSIDLPEPLVAPRVFPRSGGGWYLFAARGGEGSLSMLLSVSEDGQTWSPFRVFLEDEQTFRLSFLPTIAPFAQGDVVVFQSTAGGTRGSYQLYARATSDGGASWSPPTRISTFLDSERRSRVPASADEVDNQVPHLSRIGGTLWLTWLRRVGSENEQVFAAPLSDALALDTEQLQRVSSGESACSEPRLFEVDGAPAIGWSENRGAGRVLVAVLDRLFWDDEDLSLRSGGGGAFGRAIYADGALWAFWQAGTGGSTSVQGLLPDRSVSAPSLAAADFTPGQASRSSRAGFRWTAPADSSGILGYSYAWSQDPSAEPEENILRTVAATRLNLDAPADGSWYLAVKAVDFAGNWSESSRLRYERDTTPPSEPAIIPPAASGDGFLASNSFRLLWDAPPEADVAGYTWVLDYLGPLDRMPARKRGAQAGDAQAEAAGYALEPATDYERTLWNARTPAEPAPSVRTVKPSADFSNLDDGYWSVAVAAIDRTGNVGPSSRAILRADKFVPYTAISDVRVSRDEFGALSFSVLGRGFSDDGFITQLALDDDGREPFQLVLELGSGDYKIRSDRLIDGARAEDMPMGSWRVGAFHPKRGWLFSKPVITVDETGTVKLGPPGPAWKPTWTFYPKPGYVTDLGTVFMYLALLLPLAGVILSFRQAALAIAQGALIRREALALLEGKPMPAKERERAVKAAIRKGAGLTAKFALTISMLVIFVVALVSVPLALQLMRSQSATLASGLSERAEVLLESAVQGGRAYLPSKDDINLSNIPYQVSAVQGALWMTITGYGSEKSTNPDIVWATNEPDATLSAKLDSDGLRAGVSGLRDSLSPLIQEIASELDKKALEEVGELASYTQDLRDENVRLSIQLARAYSADLDARQQELSSQIRANDTRVREILAAISDASVASVPAFDPDRLSLEPEEYVFYKPILYAQGREPVFYRGMVRLAVTTEYIVAAVKDARAALFRSIAIVAAVALAAGVVGSIILSGIIINPIRRLVRGIETIRDTPDKKDLADFSIEVKSKDELETLADTINDMTMGLVVAAREAEFLTVGKDVQKMFIPLESNSFGEKLTTGHDERPTHTFFGYYEGAKGVSGDYFDYRQLDDRYWAFIKCDVSGKGVPAALIMVGVATIFTSEFQNWSFKKNGIKLDELTYRINDFLFRRGFKGRFAAFLMGVYDSKTGAAYLCHAGDKFVYIYSAQKREMIKHELVSASGDAAPAAGPIDSDLIMMGKAPFTQVTKQLSVGDTLILYTDGFEESNRARRNPDFSEMYEVKKTKNADGTESSHKEALVEYLGEERIKEIVEAIMKGGRWTLRKEDDPLGPDIRYDFDFSSCAGKPDELVLGLAAVEKVFRMVPDPKATADDMVLVDSKLDAMLERCFVQYSAYCRDKIDHPNPRRTEYKYWRRMKEDDQYDDLTMMVIRRNT